jgi:transposase
VIHHRCAGLDVPKRAVVACVLVTQPEGPARRAVRTFGTRTADLVALSDWLRAQPVERVVLESTGGVWWPGFTLQEAGGHAVVLVNPQQVKATPTDCSHRQHGLSRCNGGGDRPRPPAVRPAPAAG